METLNELGLAIPNPKPYPRPDFQRPTLNWESLNGTWDFLFDDDDVGFRRGWHLNGLPEAGKRHIEVPYVFQCKASGINERRAHEVFWYERWISDCRSADERSEGQRPILRLGAVDYEARLWLDGIYLGSHIGGHVPFEVDLSDAIQLSRSQRPGEYRLTIRVRDSPDDLTQPRGKQYWGPKPESIFYTPSSGIWQSVWLEVLPLHRISDSSHGTVIRSDDIENGKIHAAIAISGKHRGYSVEMEVLVGDYTIASDKQEVKNTGYANLTLLARLSAERALQLPPGRTKVSYLERKNKWKDGIALWSPEHPFLYNLHIKLYDESGKLVDVVWTTTGFRSLDWNSENGTFKLNGKPYFQALVLDQGYWPESGITPPSYHSHAFDIQASKRMGFNGCRKHQKVEDPHFLYWADQLGFIVWGEMANAYEFGQKYMERFNAEWIEAVRRDINHPCIFTWTPVNESWGYTSLDSSCEQRDHIRSLYYMTK
jgi:beta-galactosidase/beta-glucuronidase